MVSHQHYYEMTLFKDLLQLVTITSAQGINKDSYNLRTEKEQESESSVAQKGVQV